jgi:hypothetical protein
MTPRKIAVFITVDLAFLLLVLLLLAYYGMSHLLLLAMGLGFLILTAFDLRSGNLSAIFSDFMGFDNPEEIGRYRWLPVILSTLLLILSIPVFLEHGLVNSAQRWAMQHGQFWRVALPAVLGGIAVIAVAVWTLFKGSNNSR